MRQPVSYSGYMHPLQGKYIKLLYDQNFCLVGGRTEHFLLEKSRLVKVDPGERGYHIFYQVQLSRDEADATAASAVSVTL